MFILVENFTQNLPNDNLHRNFWYSNESTTLVEVIPVDLIENVVNLLEDLSYYDLYHCKNTCVSYRKWNLFYNELNIYNKSISISKDSVKFIADEDYEDDLSISITELKEMSAFLHSSTPLDIYYFIGGDYAVKFVSNNFLQVVHGLKKQIKIKLFKFSDISNIYTELGLMKNNTYIFPSVSRQLIRDFCNLDEHTRLSDGIITSKLELIDDIMLLRKHYIDENDN